MATENTNNNSTIEEPAKAATAPQLPQAIAKPRIVQVAGRPFLEIQALCSGAGALIPLEQVQALEPANITCNASDLERQREGRSIIYLKGDCQINTLHRHRDLFEALVGEAPLFPTQRDEYADIEALEAWDAARKKNC